MKNMTTNTMITKGDVAVVVSEYVSKNVKFNVSDVTGKLRNRGFYCSYNEVKALVAECMATIENYVSSKIAIPAIPPKSTGVAEACATAFDAAKLKTSIDKASFASLILDGKTIPIKKASPPIMGRRSTAKVGNRGRVWINLKDLGIKSGDKIVAEAVINPLTGINRIDIFKPWNSSSTSYNYYTADDTPGIKISGDIVSRAFGVGVKSLKKTIYKDKIVLER